MSSAQQRTPESIDPLVIAFNKIDVDRSGTITSQEFFTRLHEEGFDMGKEEFDTLFEFIDKDVSCVRQCQYICVYIMYCNTTVYLINIYILLIIEQRIDRFQ